MERNKMLRSMKRSKVAPFKHHIRKRTATVPRVASAKADLGVVGKGLAQRKEELMAGMQA